MKSSAAHASLIAAIIGAEGCKTVDGGDGLSVTTPSAAASGGVAASSGGIRKADSLEDLLDAGVTVCEVDPATGEHCDDSDLAAAGLDSTHSGHAGHDFTTTTADAADKSGAKDNGNGNGNGKGHVHPDPTDPTNPTDPTDPTDPSHPPMNGGTHAEHMALMNMAPVSAATHVAVNNGSWFDPNTWANGQVPGDGAKVLIPQGLTVSYDGQSQASLFTVRVDGALEFATDVDTFMEVDTMIVMDTGSLTIGTEANPVEAGVNAVIQIADNGPIDVAWDPLLLSRGVVTMGNVEIHGAEKDAFLKVAIDPMKGDTTLTLESTPDGWQVGDTLVLAGTHLVKATSAGRSMPVIAATEDEELVITAINGNVITFDRPLQYDHDAPRADLKTYVANYSRNIVFETENADNLPVHQRGHVMIMGADTINVQYAEFTDLGRTDKSERAFDVLTLSSVTSDTNIKARYSLHLHHTGTDSLDNPAIIEGNAVWGSPGWGFVQHDSNAIMANNAAYDVLGAAFVAETGNETGRWVDNISIKSLGVNHITKGGGDVQAFDLGRTGTGFWFQGRMVEAVGNVAASVPSGAGFTYFHRQPGSSIIPVDPASSPLGDILRYEDGVDPNVPHIAVFADNESFATQMGLEVIKANPRQDHDARSVIDGFTAWEVTTGVHLQYTGHYTFTDLDLVGTRSTFNGAQGGAGVELFKNVVDVVINGANIEGFNTGVEQTKFTLRGLDVVSQNDLWEYVYIDVNITGAKVDFSNPTSSDLHLTGSQLSHGQLAYFSPYAETDIQMIKGVYNINGEKLDSIGRTEVGSQWDVDYINRTELRGALEQNGYWTTVDGRRVTLIEEYVSDRASGELMKVGLFVEVPSNFSLQAGGFTRIDASYNGVLNQNSAAPVANDDFAHVQQGHSVLIDLLANDRDPDGDAMQVDGLMSQSGGHVVNNGDGTATYFADPGFSGDDVFYYWVQDSNGDISKGQVTVTVDI
ncbi:MAG: G8 domain-containing protein [Parvularculaceae bacterium]